MLAARLNLETGEFGVKDVPIPDPQAGWVRVKVKACGVCLTDLHIIGGHLRGPHRQTGEITLGHEISGEVDVVGSDVEGWTQGDRVAISLLHNQADGEHTVGVDFDGGWAEYVVAPASTLVRIPDTLPFDVASIVPDAVSTPWAAITQTADVRAGESVAVWGVGGVGTHAIQILRFVGAAPIIAVDPLPEARERALRLGADYAIDPNAEDAVATIKGLTKGTGVNVAFDFVGISAVEAQLLQAAAPFGRTIWVGANSQPFTLETPGLLLFLRQQIRGHYASGPEAVPELLDLLALNRLDFSESISGHYPLSDVAEAIEQLQSKKGNPVRLVIVP
ncbi:zinc-binding dehydrogenase [Herbiconiux ginsengi]|uniref:D-arabinose 1-dehydrogenase, Zn-dependent alcohol dehydrogenase family n=1 Tax=Herbiconiux ginsengi TaxID=381665 RepID=A0A1H3TBY9_9MICO|nr:zinc-binding dehydrogenase [Herbiconiux ginsengi]SDZ47756.1 D-arabinose 1-dehydrogenase, Zn-dependent alcohol dehydrogenase family [Herbiconiux ginsengi]